VATARNCKAILGVDARVAMLSFSTKGSASHADVDKVSKATEIARQIEPGIMIDGELQADSALIPNIGEKKAPGSPVAGKANVLIFPDLDAGNIGYKLVERIGGAEAIGPVIQGLARQVNDLSAAARWMILSMSRQLPPSRRRLDPSKRVAIPTRKKKGRR